MSYFTLADVYDNINSSAYVPYAEMLMQNFALADIKVREVLDLGCGTGGIAAILADNGFDMVGLDISPDMLNYARERNAEKNTLLLCQDMREFELYGTVQAIYSSFDCLNYITESKDLKRVFVLAHNYLEKGGLFIFDVNTQYRYERVYANNSFVYEFDGVFAVWRNSYDEKTRKCEFEIDIFGEDSDGSYDRSNELCTQKLHTREEILKAAEGFELVTVSGGKGFDGCEEKEKEYYIFKRV